MQKLSCLLPDNSVLFSCFRNTWSNCVKHRLFVISPDTATGDSGSTAAECPLCQLPLGSVECFDSHTERDGAGYMCQVCDCRTRNKTEARRHLRVHTREKPFSCPHCPLRAARRHHINSHIRIVHGG